MKKTFTTILALASIFVTPLAQAGEVKGVVELFTSQGCSSCPPADKVLGEVSEQGGILALAFHVDYWDRLGWKDTFSSKGNTQRQRGYAAGFGTGTIYTPQFVVNGLAEPGSGSSQGIRTAISALGTRGHSLNVPVDLKTSGGELVINAGAGSGNASVVLVTYVRSKVVNIERGENSGRKIEYRNAVTGIRTIGKWSGAQKTFNASLGGASGVAVLLQRTNSAGGPGEIIGAAVARN
jgi:hypothetical protein